MKALAKRFLQKRKQLLAVGKDVKPTKGGLKSKIKSADDKQAKLALEWLFEQGKLVETGAGSGGAKYAWAD